MFDKTHYNLGTVKAGVEQTLTFNLVGGDKIVSASASCGCSIPSFKDKQLTVKFTPQPLIEGIIERVDRKTVTATVKTGASNTQVALSFEATVK